MLQHSRVETHYNSVVQHYIELNTYICGATTEIIDSLHGGCALTGEIWGFYFSNFRKNDLVIVSFTGMISLLFLHQHFCWSNFVTGHLPSCVSKAFEIHINIYRNCSEIWKYSGLSEI